MTPAGRQLRGAGPLFASTLFVSAALLFTVEPMFAKMLLPRLGGAPSVWNACMLFFQAALLAGYALAARLSGLPVRLQAAAYAALLAAGWIALPVALRPSALGAAPEWQALACLAAGVGLPFLALSASAPLLQSWYSRGEGNGERDPYFLYQASSLGSLAGLLLYPAAIEPGWGLARQSQLWSIGYSGFALLCGLCAWRAGAFFSRGSRAAVAAAQIAADGRRWSWLALSAAPSVMLLALTSYLSGFIAPVPLLWTLPLAVYLATFAVAFARRPLVGSESASRAAAILLAPAALMWAADVVGPLWLVLPLHLAALAAAALACHTRLAESRPQARELGRFYLWLAAGGALGGLLNMTAPLVFNGFVEYPAALVAAAWLLPGESMRKADALKPLLLGLVTAAIPLAVAYSGSDLHGLSLKPLLALAALLSFLFKEKPARYALALACVLGTSTFFLRENGRPIAVVRSFFGQHRVLADRRGFHWLLHGGIVHGGQSLDPALSRRPLMYYHPAGPFGRAFSLLSRRVGAAPVAVVGLGTGSLACYALPGQPWTFFEIDPAVETLAREERLFTFARDCPARVVLGDARLTLAGAPAGSFGWIVVDAFGGDAIPVHLLTAEALELYVEKLAPGGIVALHLSSRFLDLEPVVGALASKLGLAALHAHDEEKDDPSGKAGSRWALLARRREDLAALAKDPLWRAPRAGDLWTDDRSTILPLVKWSL